MNIGGFTATSIWNAVTRTLTGLGANTLPLNQVLNGTIAATSTVSLSPGAGTGSLNSIAAVANAGGTIVLQFTDGTNTWTAVTIAISTTGGQDTAVSTSGAFWQIHNNSASSATYFFNALSFRQ